MATAIAGTFLAKHMGAWFAIVMAILSVVGIYGVARLYVKAVRKILLRR